MPLVPAASIPERPVMPSIVIDLVMVTEPKPPGSSASISPAAAVLEMAPAKVLQGAVRLHGLASSPTPETQVLVACAWAGADPRMIAYHDQEWGVPVHDDRLLFEFITLEGAQAGLSWQTILNKRDAYREA